MSFYDAEYTLIKMILKSYSLSKKECNICLMIIVYILENYESSFNMLK